jgi:hypothetical protein
MPITQDRMLRILTAYRTIVTYFTTASATLDAAVSGIRENGKLAQAQTAAKAGNLLECAQLSAQAFNDLESIAGELLSPANKFLLPANMTLMEEEAHFKKWRKHNDQRRIYQRNRRDRDSELTEAERYRTGNFHESESGVPGGPTISAIAANESMVPGGPTITNEADLLRIHKESHQPTNFPNPCAECEEIKANFIINRPITNEALPATTIDAAIASAENLGFITPKIEENFDDDIPELPTDYSREDYERDRAARRAQAHQGSVSINKPTTQG